MSVATLGGFPPDAGGFSTGVQGRSSLGQQKPLFNQARAGTSSTGRSVLPARVQPQALLASIAEVDSRVQGPNARSHSRTLRTNIVPVRFLAPLCTPKLSGRSSAYATSQPCLGSALRSNSALLSRSYLYPPPRCVTRCVLGWHLNGTRSVIRAACH